MAVLGLYCLRTFPVVAARGVYSLVAVRKLLIAVASLVAKHRLWGLWASVATAPGVMSIGSMVVAHCFVAPRHVGCSWVRDRTHVACIGRWILYH